MSIRLSYAIGLVLASATLSATACATSDNAGSAGGVGGVGGVGGKDGSADGAGGSSASGGSGGSTGGKGGTSSGGGGMGGASGQAGADSGTGGNLGDGGGSTITGHVVDLLTQQTPIPGVVVCIYDDASVPCVTTDAGGAYSIGPLPAGSEVLVKYTKSGYFPALVTVHTAPGLLDVGKFPAPTNDEASAFAQLVGTTIDFTKGQLLALALTGTTGSLTGQDGVTATLTPSSGSGAFYLGDQGYPDKTLNYTSTFGAALFANVTPGDVDVELKHYSKNCQRYATSWVGSKPDSAKVRLVGGYLTGGAAVVCP